MEERQSGPGAVVAAGIGLYLLALLVARLVIQGVFGWWILGGMSVILVLVLASRAGFGVGLVVVGLFVGLAVAFRWVMQSGLGWPVLLLFPVVAITAVIAGKVLGALKADRVRSRTPPESGASGGSKPE